MGVGCCEEKRLWLRREGAHGRRVTLSHDRLPDSRTPGLPDVLVGRSRHLGDEAVRYAIAGGISAAVEFAGFASFHHGLGWSTVAATIGGHGGSILVNYVLNAFWVFRYRRHPRIALELPCFLAIAGIGMGINVGVMHLAERSLDLTGMMAKVPASFLVAVWAVAAKRLWLFARPRPAAGNPQ